MVMLLLCKALAGLLDEPPSGLLGNAVQTRPGIRQPGDEVRMCNAWWEVGGKVGIWAGKHAGW